MINRIVLAIYFVSIYSCSSTKVTTSYKDIDQIKKDDFKPVKQIRYKKSDDFLIGVQSEYTSALNEESIERIFKYDGDIELTGALGEVAKFCYNKEFGKAEQVIKVNNRRYLKNPIFWNQVGTCYLLKGERRKALLFFNKALSSKQNYAPALNNLGVMYMKENDYSRALVAFSRARKSSNFNKTPRFNLGILYLNFGLYDKAISQANTLYTPKSRDVDVLNILATSYLMKNIPSKAVSYFKNIESDFLEKPQFGLNYSLALYLNGKQKEAKNIFNDIDKDKVKGRWSNYYKGIGNYIGVTL